MEEAVESGRGRWSTAIGLTLAVLLLSVFDALAMVLLPLAILFVALPANRRAGWIAAGISLWLVALLLSGGTLSLLARAWAFVLGAAYLAVTLAKPDWDVISRALSAAAFALVVGALGLVMTGQGAEVDGAIRSHFENISAVTVNDIESRLPDAAWVTELRNATARISELQIEMFPALLGLQSLAALALVSWWTRRLGRSESGAFELAPLREFRFNDQLIWVLILAIIVVLLPVGELGVRIGANILVFMGALYALRGLAIFVFLAASSRSILTVGLGVLALILLYPVAFTAALLMGVGDTWLDVRRRVATSASPS